MRTTDKMIFKELKVLFKEYEFFFESALKLAGLNREQENELRSYFDDVIIKFEEDFLKEETSFLKRAIGRYFIKDEFISSSLVSEAKFITKLMKDFNSGKLKTEKTVKNLNARFRGGFSKDDGVMELHLYSPLEKGPSLGVIEVYGSKEGWIPKLSEVNSIFMESLGQAVQKNEKLAVAFHLIKEFFDILKKLSS